MEDKKLMEKPIESILDIVKDLHDYAISRNIKGFDGYLCFRAFCKCYEYSPQKQQIREWDYALCNTNMVLEERIKLESFKYKLYNYL